MPANTASAKKSSRGPALKSKATAKKSGKKLKSTAPERIAQILSRLAEMYPGAKCALHHSNAWELLVATILSAQCTDVRVNMVTPGLFKRFPTPQAMAKASLPEIEEIIRSTGFYHQKAISLLTTSRLLVDRFGGQVPRAMKDLLTL